MGACFSTNFVSRTSSCTSFWDCEREQTTAARERRSARVGSLFLLARASWVCTLGVEVTILSTHELPLTSPMARRRRGWPVKPSAPQHIESLVHVLQQRTPHVPSRQRRCVHAHANFLISQGNPVRGRAIHTRTLPARPPSWKGFPSRASFACTPGVHSVSTHCGARVQERNIGQALSQRTCTVSACWSSSSPASGLSTPWFCCQRMTMRQPERGQTLGVLQA
jgi:hypothetical protein